MGHVVCSNAFTCRSRQLEPRADEWTARTKTSGSYKPCRLHESSSSAACSTGQSWFGNLALCSMGNTIPGSQCIWSFLMHLTVRIFMSNRQYRTSDCEKGPRQAPSTDSDAFYDNTSRFSLYDSNFSLFRALLNHLFCWNNLSLKPSQSWVIRTRILRCLPPASLRHKAVQNGRVGESYLF